MSQDGTTALQPGDRDSVSNKKKKKELRLTKDSFRYTKAERIHHQQAHTLTNVKNKSFRQKESDTRSKFRSTQRNEEHHKWFSILIII